MRHFTETRTHDGLMCDFAATLDNIEHLCRRVEDFLTARGIQEARFEVLLLLREMVNNAVIHGCERNAGKRVKVRLSLDREILHMDIEDQGQGFNWQQLETANALNSNACSGRGAFIARSYSDSYAYNGPGNKVMLTKRVRPQADTSLSKTAQ